MGRIRIFCDSGADLAAELIQKYDIEVLPLVVINENVEYRDGVDISPSELYANMRSGVSYSTSQVTLEVFAKAMREVVGAGDEFLYISVSSKLSGTCDAARVARNKVLEEQPQAKIEVVDSLCVSSGCGMVVVKAAQLVESGMAIEDIAKEAFDFYPRVQHVFTVDDMVYLYRGGRVSKTSAFLAGALDIKPLLVVEEGALLAVKKVRGERKALSGLVDMMKERVDAASIRGQEVWISHADAHEKVKTMIDLVKEEFDVENFIVADMGAVVGAHAGPGALAVFFLDTKV
ncbi:MAG: DegV family protein [Eubacteriaceae bacterium]|nr:DegV family protein [Eubacteriaceae bacterium]